MKIGIISGSHRQDSQSRKVANFLEKTLQKDLGVSTYLYSLQENPIPLWEESIWSGDQKWQDIWGPVEKDLRSCDAFVIISPEWSGMATAGLKNFFLMCGGASGPLSHKPGLLVGVSSGVGGTYVIAELRMSSYKNTRLNYIPEHLIIRDVEKILNTPDAEPGTDTYMRDRIQYSLKLLKEYGVAAQHVLKSGVIDSKTYPNGM